MPANIESIRNIGIIAHIDAGKTTTTERILYYTGASHRMGNVDDGDTETDFDPEEAERGITIYSAAVSCKWKESNINIIDTPGHVDFTAEVERSLRVLDGAVVIFSAVEGVEAQSETVWRQADSYQVPRICFINKMDRIGADFDRTFKEIESRLSARPVAITLPMGSGSAPDPNALSGIIDLIEMKALYFDSDSRGKEIRAEEIPEQYLEEAQLWQQQLHETCCEFDDVVMEAYLETESIEPAEIRRVLRAATLLGKVQPTFTGSSLDYIGVQPVLDGVTAYLPSPIDRPALEGTHPNPKKQDKTQRRRPDKSDPLACLVFKIQADQHGDLYFVRVYSGVLKSNSRLLNPRTGKKELISQIWHIQASSREKLDSVEAGDIAGLIGPKETVTGDTLCDQQQPVILESIHFPETVISMAVEPDSSADRKKLAETLDRLSRQDPTFTARVSEETGQTIISGMGELHLEVLRHRMEREFKLKVRVHKPRVSYRETIRDTVESTGAFNRAQAGETQYAQVKIRLQPYDGPDSTTMSNKLKPGTIPQEMEKLLVETVESELSACGWFGYPLMKVHLTVLDADYREGETTDVALRAATADAVRGALSRENMVLLEPIMRVEVVTPEEFLGNIQADLNARRAMIVSSERRGDLCVLEVESALSQMFGYSTQVRSLSTGRASYTMEPLKYAEAPQEVVDSMFG